MTVRLDYFKHADALPLQALTAISGYLHESDLDPQLLALIELRASQLNSCAYCIDMHSKDLLALETPLPRILLLSAWREASVYSPAERAALAWTEAVTRLPDGETLDRCYGELTAHFSPRAITRLTFAIIAINSWNRLNVAFGQEPGQYRSGDLKGAMNRALERFADLRPTTKRNIA
ncbi:carboxymuconolactone decarboxylase family protein [Pseudomonas stutzeri]|jgi:AhpD family alkylhydroperoxidase|uniref:carboxymuconolactone decarboxylase family protein n=1 Tax=Pseudomonas TaxID=286 RepID=UPI00051D5565|nr:MULTISPECIES: carboxymuconolactone decarboxylase family protein [Pseudomonas]KGK83122.1 alkylhydroperoxidase [Stutzerimonas degradans]MDT3711229.1 carboxymuconolactone decarboxylase family protein [Pseudomonadaceae bacterium]MCQ4234614.1 carboxymuconolactone decarboxylase family protein [Stutzerimonas degradans]MCQ4268477.1 carboxymuconolactone decarboxylase family protein [Stutzerimonas degradans]OOE15293.1 alkylhydroperoxidase [Stutzerimonas degradans]